MPNSNQVIVDKIMHVLEHFPKITPSMLQISLGSGLPTVIWKPVLEELLEAEMLYRYQKTVKTPAGRTQTQTILSLHPETDGVPTKQMDDPDFDTDSEEE